tara:strand:- start:4038 stop:4532 length:495 start_codon:yes stop_codon:yes gene_type:complete
MDVVGAITILLHPILGFSLAIWLYKQWKIIKALRLKRGAVWAKIQNQDRAEVVKNHEKKGRQSLLFIIIVIAFAILANTYRYLELDTNLTSLISLHGWLGLILFIIVVQMYRTGTKMVTERERGDNIKQTRGVHQRAGDLLIWLLVAVVFLGFLRLLDVLQQLS